HNFVLALVTKAGELLVEEKPSRALTVAGSLAGSTMVQRLLEAVGVLEAKTEEAVRLKTIAEIAGRARSAPTKALKGATGATAAALTEDGARFAVGFSDGKLLVTRIDATEKPLLLLGHMARIESLHFGPPGTWLVSTTGREVLLWDLQIKTA